jgi:hypothetical protein
MNCAVFAIAEIAGICDGAVLGLIRARGWVECDDDGRVDSVAMPEAAVAVLRELGHGVASYRGTGPATAEGWARWSARWYPGIPLLLVVDSAMPDAVAGDAHALVARDGLLRDNNVPDGLPGAEHPHGNMRVRVVLRVYDNDAATHARRWATAAG